MYRITLNTPFIDYNKYSGMERSNKYLAAKTKQKIETNICIIAKNARFKLPDNKMFDVEIIWFVPNNKIDHDNVSFCKKFIFDGLQKSNSLQKDSPKHIRNFSEKFLVNKAVKHIHCSVTFVEVEI